MPKINEYKCNKCGFTLERGWGYRFYVEDDKGNRTDCHHPRETRYVEEVLGKNLSLELVRERTGFHAFCMCVDCLHQFRADLGYFEMYWSPYEPYFWERMPRLKGEKDKRECPECESWNVKTELEMVGETCPKCKEGEIEEIWTGAMS